MLRSVPRARSLAALVALVALVACTDHGAASLTKIKDKVCACTTASCAEQELARVPKDAIESNHRTQTIARDMLACLAKLQAAERPRTDPDDDEAPPATGSDPRPAPGVAAPAASAPSPGAPAKPR
jgi:hypothetical protein